MLSNVASILFLGLLLSIIVTGVLELRWSGIGIEEWWRNEQFWVIGGVSAHLFTVLSALERAQKIKYVIFDKTGTLTQGKATVTTVKVFTEMNRGELLTCSFSGGWHS